jgi:tRNA pseudouridine38-40 synthase
MNYKLTIQYDGTDFFGWQIQEPKRTVQGELTRVLSLLEGRNVIVHGSGRTDSGVHAEGQVASVRLDREFEQYKLRNALNGNLERDLRVVKVEQAPDSFHARFSATGKTYLYRIANGPVMPPLWRRIALHEARPLDLPAMIEATSLFHGRHDWTGFSAAQSDVDSRIRTITELEIKTIDDERSGVCLFEIRASADGFLRYMVRAIVGALMAVGRHELGPGQLKESIESGGRIREVVTVPAHGLTLLEVHYN